MSHSDSNKKITSRQIVALVGVILLVALYIVTLLTAFFDRSASGRYFIACLAATIVIPILIWLYSWIYARVTNRRAIGDVFEEDTPGDNS